MMMTKLAKLMIAMTMTAVFSTVADGETIPLSSLDLGKVQQDHRKAVANLSVDKKPLRIGNRAFEGGVGTHANSGILVNLQGGTRQFTAFVGVDAEVSNPAASVEFYVKGDGKVLWRSGVMKAGEEPKKVDLAVSGISLLGLFVSDGGDGINSDHADWADAKFEVTGAKPETVAMPPREKVILTPKPGPQPRINGPSVFGVRSGSPFIYSIPATGTRPMTFEAGGLPGGLKLNTSTGRITGALTSNGEHVVTLRARNSAGAAEKRFRIVVGDEIALTPPMGWNSWNCWGEEVDQGKVLRSARALVSHGLNQHGWSYVNIDDAWQGERGGEFHAIQPNQKFPNVKELCDEVHGMGLKVGIYSTPWTVSYGRKIGGSSENPEGKWNPAAFLKAAKNNHSMPFAVGPYRFVKQDVRQWADWGFDYLKYDWGPVDVANTLEMADALRGSGRDLVFSLSNNAAGNVFSVVAELSPLAQAWRTTGDINDSWGSMSGIGFGQDKWSPFQRPGHYNDPDMLVVGQVGWGKPHPTRLTPDEQYTHLSLWCLLGAPLLIGCDLETLDEFTLGLLTNDEVLAIDQDALCQPATRVHSGANVEVYAKSLEDGSIAVGLFNRNGIEDQTVTATWPDLKLKGPQRVQDLWRQKDLGVFDGKFEATVAPHGVMLIRVYPVH